MTNRHIEKIYREVLKGKLRKSLTVTLFYKFYYILPRVLARKIIYIYGVISFISGNDYQAEKCLRYSALVDKKKMFIYTLFLVRIKKYDLLNRQLTYICPMYKTYVYLELIKRNFTLDYSIKHSDLIKQILNKNYNEAFCNIKNKKQVFFWSKELYVFLLYKSKSYSQISEDFIEDFYPITNYGLYMLGNLLFKLNRYGDSNKILKIITNNKTKTPIFINSILYRASILRNQGSYFKALLLLKQIIKCKDPSYKGKIYLSIALCYQQAGIVEKAIKWYGLTSDNEIVDRIIDKKQKKLLLNILDLGLYKQIKKDDSEPFKKLMENKKRIINRYSFFIALIPLSLLFISSIILIFYFLFF